MSVGLHAEDSGAPGQGLAQVAAGVCAGVEGSWRHRKDSLPALSGSSAPE